MTQTAIPAEFETYLQEKINAGGVPDMNQIIFAYLPNLDLNAAIDRGAGLPDEDYWVHQQNIDQSGKLGDNALVYSVVIASNEPAFTFNAIYLHDKNAPQSCGMVIHKEDETKEAGMASTKSLVQQYSGAALMSGITVDAATWQLDYQARLLGIEEDHRLNCLDSYGHSAFIDGLVVTQQADPTKYKITPGLAYIGGLRITLDVENIQTIVNKPSAIYLDVHREGTALSLWDNILTITLSESALTDYTDGTGKQHYVAKLATINADGSISNLKEQATGELERADNAATNAEIDQESNAEKHVKLPQFWRGVGSKVSALALVAQFVPWSATRTYKTGEVCTIEENGEVMPMQMYAGPNLTCLNKDPLDLTNRHEQWADSTSPFWWITYTGTEVGTPFWWLDTTPPESAVMEINADLPTAVYWRLARRYPDLVDGETINTGEIRGEFLRVLDQGRGVDTEREMGEWQKGSVVVTDPSYSSAGVVSLINSVDNSNNLFNAKTGLDDIDYTNYSGVLKSNLTNGNIGTLNSGGYQAGSSRPRNIARAMAITI